MRKHDLSFVFVSFLLLLFVLYSFASATKSRLSGMGDLSIVIEDESNMINLWDFARNPAGFLADEKGSVIRGDFLWDTYEIRNLGYWDYEHPYGYHKYDADGDIFDNWISVGFRRDEDFALAVEGNYFFRETDSRYHKDERTYPKIFLTFTKNLNSRIAFGVNLKYLEYDSEFSEKIYQSKHQFQFKNLGAEIGVGSKFLSGVTVGVLLGYDSFEPDEDSDLSNSYSIWLSGQTILEIEHKLKFGMETIFKFKRSDFKWTIYDETGEEKKENYYFSCLRFRGVYDFSSKLSLGLFFFDNEEFAGFYDPVLFYSLFPYEAIVRHWGVGCSYNFNKSISGGMEYHFRDSSEPNGIYPDPGLKNESFNLGVEGKLSEALSLRGGYIRTETNQNPNFDKQRDTWENALTLGLGYEPYRWNLIVEFSYRHSFKKFKQWYGEWDVESEKHVFSLSLKKVL